MAGLLEAVAGRPDNGKADLPVIAEALHMPVDELVPVVEFLHYLGFAELKSGDLLLMQPAKTFAEADTDTRKRTFAQHLLASVPLVELIRRFLDERPGHRARRVRFDEELEDYMSDDFAEATLDQVINWGRYAELFAYDDETETSSLENPVALTVAAL
jgi:NitT/TauT family transport system ATP-binding protein